MSMMFSGQGSADSTYGTFADPFADWSSMHAPRDLRTMLRWSEVFYANNATYRMGLERVCSYFLTKVEILDVTDVVKRRYDEFLNDTMRIASTMRAIGLDFLFYGNSFSSVFQPFRRYLRCMRCNIEKPIDEVMYVFRDYDFFSECPHCRYKGKVERSDRRSTEHDKFKVIRWSPHNMRILFHELSHEADYVMRLPYDFMTGIKRSLPFYLKSAPWEFIEAVKEGQGLFTFNPNVVFHLKEDTLAGILNRGWGIPKALSNFKQGFYIQALKRYNEAIAMDYIVPWRIVTPASAGKGGTNDPIINSSMADFTGRVNRMIAEHRRDPLMIHSMPFPVEYQTLSGEARNLAPTDLMTFAQDELLNGIGVPAELYKGTLQLQAMPAALRLFEASWPSFVGGMNNWLNWLMESVAMTFNWERARARLTPVVIADDMEARAIRLQLAAAHKISDGSAMASMGLDVRDEIRKMFDEQRIMEDEQRKADESRAKELDMERRMSETAQFGRPLTPAMAAQLQAQGGGGGQPMPQGGPQLPSTPGGYGGGPTTPQDTMDQARQMAMQMAPMPDAERRRQLAAIKKQDPTLHAAVRQQLEQVRNEARSQGGDQLIQQMGSGPQ